MARHETPACLVTADMYHKIPSLTGSHWGKHHPRSFRGGHIKVAFSCEHRLLFYVKTTITIHNIRDTVYNSRVPLLAMSPCKTGIIFQMPLKQLMLTLGGGFKFVHSCLQVQVVFEHMLSW